MFRAKERWRTWGTFREADPITEALLDVIVNGVLENLDHVGKYKNGIGSKTRFTPKAYWPTCPVEGLVYHLCLFLDATSASSSHRINVLMTNYLKAASAPPYATDVFKGALDRLNVTQEKI